MQLSWSVSDRDIADVHRLVDRFRGCGLVLRRQRRNLSNNKGALGRAEIWRSVVGCLLTTQQRSGPKSAVARFMGSAPFLLSYDRIVMARAPATYAQRVLSSFGGLRRHAVISKQLAANLEFLEAGGWTELLAIDESLRGATTQPQEADAADWVDDHLKGFGPKQARNLFQALGRFRWEVPLDSRTAAWLNDGRFPFKVTSTALGDRGFYAVVQSGIQQLALAADIAPCILDAVVFASVDKDPWREQDADW